MLRAVLVSLSDDGATEPADDNARHQKRRPSAARLAQLRSELLNARTATWQTPLMLACETG